MILNLKGGILSALALTDLALGHGNSPASTVRWTSIQDAPGKAEIDACLTNVNTLQFAFEMDSTTSSSSTDSSTNSTSSSSSGNSYHHGGSKRRQQTTVSYDAICGYPPASGTYLLCVYKMSHNSTKILKKASKSLVESCKASTTFSYDWEYYYTTQFKNATENYVPYDEIASAKYIYTNTYPNMTAVKSTYDTDKSGYFSSDSGTWFSVAFYGYFLFLIFCSAIYNFFRLTGFSKRINGSMFAKLCQKYVIFPTLIPKGKYSEPYGFKYFSMLFPNRIQFLTDLFFFAFEVAFYCVPYRTTHTWNKYVGIRSGIMAFGKIPLLILFAGRNDFLLWITGWSYSTFLHFHKVVAWWMFVDSLIHSVSYTIQSLGTYVSRLHQRWYACGVLATLFCGLILLQSLHVFRTFFYEYFLTIHIAFVIVFIAMCWFHCNGLGWMEWLVAACCVWFFDRLCRLIRVSAFGYRKATITAIADDLMKLEVRKPKWWYHTPGTYGYVYFAGIIFWENHPFTIVMEGENICAYIKVKRGLTSRVWKKLLKNNNLMEWRVTIEGPYGGQLSHMHKKYDDAIFIAGGSGVPGILEGAAHATSGKFIFVSQSVEFISAYRNLLQQVSIPIDIYVTRATAESKKCSMKELLSDNETDSQVASTDTSDKDVSDKEVESTGDQQISFYYGRPDFKKIIEAEINVSTSNNLCISACGPPKLMDDLRNVIANNVTNWPKSIDFFDEFQVW